jgi:hypothetical protein
MLGGLELCGDTVGNDIGEGLEETLCVRVLLLARHRRGVACRESAKHAHVSTLTEKCGNLGEEPMIPHEVAG